MTLPTCMNFGASMVTIYTDHCPLKYIQTMQNKNRKFCRWALELQQFSFNIQHRAGKYNILPDLLSRPSTTMSTLRGCATELCSRIYVQIRTGRCYVTRHCVSSRRFPLQSFMTLPTCMNSLYGGGMLRCSRIVLLL